MSKLLLVVGGGLEAVPGIEKARKMGLQVVVSDSNPDAPGFAAADYCIEASTYDAESTVKKAVEFSHRVSPIDGVICIASDIPYTVASVASALGLPGISLDSASLSMNKLAMKEKFSADSVPVPWFKELETFSDLEKTIRDRGYPLVIKPIDSRGARGVLQLQKSVDPEWAFSLAKSYSPAGRVIVEEFIEGPQVSTESLVVNGKTYTVGFSDRNYEFLDLYAPFIVENGGELPSHLPEKTRHDVCLLLEKAAASMGITDGVIKGDVVIQEGKPLIIEIAARLSGGYFCTHEIPLNTGVDFVGKAIKIALGERINPAELKPLYQRGVGQRYLFPQPGRVVSISGAEEVAARPEIALCEVRVRVGDIIKPIENHPGRAGVVITTAGTREEAVLRAVKAVKDIIIVTERVD